MADSYLDLPAKLAGAVITVDTVADLPTDALEGWMRYAKDTELVYYYNGSAWQVQEGLLTGVTDTDTVDLTLNTGVLQADVKSGSITNTFLGSDIDAGKLTAGTLPDARIQASGVTQHQASIDHDALTNFVADEHINWTAAGVEDIEDGRIAETSVTQHQAALALTASQVTSGTFADARISQSSVTQHQGAIDHDSLLNFVSDEHINWTAAGVEDIEDGRIAESSVTQHQSALALTATQVTSGTFADARISQSSVTQHQAALTLGAGQITTGTFFDARISASNVTQHEGALSIDMSQLTSTLGIAKGGTGQTTATAAFDALAPGTTKGDITVFDGTNHIRVGVGTDGQILKANSATSSGVEWGTGGGGASTLQEAYEGGNTITTSGAEGDAVFAGTEKVAISADGGLDVSGGITQTKSIYTVGSSALDLDTYPGGVSYGSQSMGTNIWGQQFTPSTTGNITEIRWNMFNLTGSSSGGMTLEVWTLDGSDHPDTLLGSSNTINYTALTGGDTSFPFSSPVAVTASTRYAVVFRSTISPAPSIRYATIDSYAAHEPVRSTDGGSTWAEQTGFDFDIQVDIAPVTQSAPIRLNAATSGALDFDVPATTTSHTLTFPGAQGAANTILTNDGSGGLSWAASASLTDLTLSNDLTVATDTLFVDGSADQVAIGTTTFGGAAMLTIDNPADAPTYTYMTAGGVTQDVGIVFRDGAESQKLFVGWDESADVALFSRSASGSDFTLNTSGNIGIGTATPDHDLHVHRAGSDLITTLERSGSAVSKWDIVVGDSGRIKFQDALNSNADRFTINASGRIGLGDLHNYSDATVGIKSPNDEDTWLAIQAGGSTRDAYIFFRDGDNGAQGYLGYDDSADILYFANSLSGTDLTINGSGYIGLGNADAQNNIHVTDAAGSQIRLERPTSTTNDDTIGAMSFFVGTDSVAGISAKRESATDDAYLQFLTQATGGGNSEKMRLTSTGDLGLGATPGFGEGSGLEITRASSIATLRLDTGSAALELKADHSADEVRIESRSGNDDMVFKTATGGDFYFFARGSNPTKTAGGVHISSEQAGPQLTIERTDTVGTTDGKYTIQANSNQLLIDETTDAASQGTTRRFSIGSSGGVNLGDGNYTANMQHNIRGVHNNETRGILNIQNLSGTIDANGLATPVIGIRTAKNSTSTSNRLVTFFINTTTTSGAICANGASAAGFQTFSDERLKENIATIPPQLEKIKSLRPVEFDYKDVEGDPHQVGFVAQEMEQVYPEAVGEAEGMKTIVGWSKKDAYLVKAIQELAAKVEALENA